MHENITVDPRGGTNNGSFDVTASHVDIFDGGYKWESGVDSIITVQGGGIQKIINIHQKIPAIGKMDIPLIVYNGSSYGFSHAILDGNYIPNEYSTVGFANIEKLDASYPMFKLSGTLVLKPSNELNWTYLQLNYRLPGFTDSLTKIPIAYISNFTFNNDLMIDLSNDNANIEYYYKDKYNGTQIEVRADRQPSFGNDIRNAEMLRLRNILINRSIAFFDSNRNIKLAIVGFNCSNELIQQTIPNI